MKKYQIKKFDVLGNSPRVLDSIVMNEINFTETINSGQGGLSLNLNLPFEDDSFNIGDVVEVREYDENNNGVGVYTGRVEGIESVINSKQEYINIYCQGIFTILDYVFYENGGNKVFSMNGEPADIIKDIIDFINSKYAWSGLSNNLGNTIFSYSGGGVHNYGTNIDIQFNYTKCFDAIKQIAEITGFWFYINFDGQVYFQQKPNNPTHILKIGHDISKISNKKDGGIVNKVYVEGNGISVVSYEATQKPEGLVEEKINRNDINDLATLDEFGNNYIEENKTPKNILNIDLNSLYNLEIIKPGDTITVLNTHKNLRNLQIQRVVYSPNNLTIYVDKFIKLSELLL